MRRWVVIGLLVLSTCLVPTAASEDHKGRGWRDRGPTIIPVPERPGDEVIIHKGKKCQLICTRLWDGTVECREYRC